MRLKELRLELKLTIRNLAIYTHIAPSTLSSIETGNRSPTSEQIRALAEFFGTSEKYISGESDEWINVYNQYDEMSYKVNHATYQEYLSKNILETRVFNSGIIFKFGNYISPTHCVSREIIEEFGEKISLRETIDFEKTIENLTNKQKQEVLEFIKENVKK